MKQKPEIKKHASLIHIYLLAGLILVFFGILFLSSAFKDTEQIYSFKEITQNENSYEGFEIGEIQIKNNGIISAKENLKNLVVCKGNDDLTLKYSGPQNNNYYYNTPSLEIKPKETINVKIFANYYSRYDDKSNSENFDLYIYELEKSEQKYSYCLDADKIKALAKINVNYENKNFDKKNE